MLPSTMERPVPTRAQAAPCIVDSAAGIIRCRRGQEICAQDGPVDNWYRVLKGLARRSVVRADGRRQILDLLMPGDFFGRSARGGDAFSIEAISDDTMIACYPRQRVEALADRDPRIAHEVRELAFDAITRLERQILILGRTTAREKVGHFLLKLADRWADGSTDRVNLPLSRYDIADYLAVSVETVSRAITALQERGTIVVAGPRRIRIVHREEIETEEDAV
jgi:CRP/FNR family nitrogen fixation transcriptional regulator